MNENEFYELRLRIAESTEETEDLRQEVSDLIKCDDLTEDQRQELIKSMIDLQDREDLSKKFKE